MLFPRGSNKENTKDVYQIIEMLYRNAVIEILLFEMLLWLIQYAILSNEAYIFKQRNFVLALYSFNAKSI